MEKLKIEEFPELHPDVVRAAVISAANAANSFVYQGAKVCGLRLRVEGSHLVGSAFVVLPDEPPKSGS